MLVLNVEPVAGMTIEKAIEEAIQLSNKTGCIIRIDINDILLSIFDSQLFGKTLNDRVKYFSELYRNELKQKTKD